jgi:molybdopterin-guanine dinucleotide biosynthesis protein A
MAAQTEKQFSAVVLAGGRSSRMGQLKALLPFGGPPLVARVATRLSGAFAEIIVVAGAGQASLLQPLVASARVVEDANPFPGPLAALKLGLDQAGNDAVFACSCDLPFVSPELARRLCALLDPYDAVVPVVGGRPEPLHAAYAPRVVGALIGRIVAKGETRMSAIAANCSARHVAEAELRALDPELLSFFNVNTPEDYQAALRLLARQRN